MDSKFKICKNFHLIFNRSRLGVDVGKKGASGLQGRQYNGLYDCVRKTVKSDGVVGLYRGFGVSVQGIFIYRACYFGFYDTIKASMPDPKNTPFLISFAIANVVTVGSEIVAYPWDTVRRRMMMQSGLPEAARTYKTTAECWKKIYKEEGFKAFFKGTYSNIIRGTGGALVLVFYDEIKNYIS